MYFNYLDNEPQGNQENQENLAQTPQAETPQQEMQQETLVQEQSPAGSDLDRLDQAVGRMLQESKDERFTAYLLQMRQRIAGQRQQMALLQQELDRNYQIYLNNMQRQTMQAGQQTQQQQMQQVMSQTQQQQMQQMAQQQPQQTAPRVVYQAIPTAPAPKPKKEGKNAEFTVGAAVLSIIGSIFILTGMVLVGINFMNGFAKGMGLYAICLLIVVLSEVFLYPRWQKLGMTMSALGISGLYLSTVINFLALRNFGIPVAMGVTLFLTLCVIVLSRKRDAVSYRILGMAAVYVSAIVLPVGGTVWESGLAETDFLTLIGIMFLINIMCLYVPVRRARTAINIIQMSLNTIFTAFVVILGPDADAWSEFGEMWSYPVFLAASVLVMQLIFIRQVRWQKKTDPQGRPQDHLGICVTYGICCFGYFVTFLLHNLLMGMVEQDLAYRLICSGVLFALSILTFLFLRKRPEKWFSWYLLCYAEIALFFGVENGWETVGCLVTILMLTKLLSFTKAAVLKPCDAVLTTMIAGIVLIGYNESTVFPLFVGLLFSILCLNYWKSYFEVILTGTIAVYTSLHMLPMLKLPVLVGVLFVGMLIFNNVKRWQGSGIVVYNAFMLTGQAIGYLLLFNPVYQNAFLTYFCMLIFGVSTIVICFQEKYHMNFRMKYLFLAIFLTYMALVVRTNYSVTASILMMLIALVSVGMGFAYGKKSVRIYGLVLSLVVCGKIVLYDFLEAPMLQKTIVFFVAGALALIISAIYMILEINAGKKKKKEQMAV